MGSGLGGPAIWGLTSRGLTQSTSWCCCVLMLLLMRPFVVGTETWFRGSVVVGIASKDWWLTRVLWPMRSVLRVNFILVSSLQNRKEYTCFCSLSPIFWSPSPVKMRVIVVISCARYVSEKRSLNLPNSLWIKGTFLVNALCLSSFFCI